MSGAALVPNASDVDAIVHAGRKEKRGVEARRALVAWQMSTYDGRQFVWAELEARGLFDRVLAPGTDLVALGMFLGRRDSGIDLLTEVKDEHADAYLLMQTEALARATRAKAEAEAVRIARAGKRKDEASE